MKFSKKLFLLCGALPLFGCAASRPPLRTVDNVDLQRYMGAWYVIANIPPSVEKHAFNSVETYKLQTDGSIDTTFTFNQGANDGPVKIMKSRAYVVDQVNKSTWKVKFTWPIKLEYLITSLNDDYSQAIVSRNRRDYFWILARTPQISDSDYNKLLVELQAQGYDMTKLNKVPQRNAKP